MHYADIKQFDVANGIGVRVSLFVSGCTHHCKNCFNEVAWDFNYGSEFTDETIEQIIGYLKPDYVAGLTLLGGEPLEHANQQALLPLLRRINKEYPQKNIWCFTGYDFDKDIKNHMMKAWPETVELMSYVDVLVDGKFIEALKSVALRFKGSSNQRTIDVKASLEKGETVILEGF